MTPVAIFAAAGVVSFGNATACLNSWMVLRSEILKYELSLEVRPQDDLFRHVNGQWIEKCQIPEDQASSGMFRQLHDTAASRVRSIVEGMGPGTQIGDLYASFMDTEQIELQGTAAIDDELSGVLSSMDASALARSFGSLQRVGAIGAIRYWVGPDPDDATLNVLHLSHSALGLPSKAHYVNDEHGRLRSEYASHVGSTLESAGVLTKLGVDASTASVRVMSLEGQLASAHPGLTGELKAESADKGFVRTTSAALRELIPQFPWHVWADGLGLPAAYSRHLVVHSIDALANFGRVWARMDLLDWKLWAAFCVVTARAPYLPEAIARRHFEFYGRTLTGAVREVDRWRRGVELVESSLGDLVGREYVNRFFSEDDKLKVERIARHVISAYRTSLVGLDWMADDTKHLALSKLDALSLKIGYPERWRDYSSVRISPTDLQENVRGLAEHRTRERLRRIGVAVSHGEWAMNPQRVNAYYDPRANEVVVPAGMLQPPFFDSSADEPENFGGIGSLMGHEISHAVDGFGAKYGPDGRKSDWWTAEDYSEYSARVAPLVDQYVSYVPAQLVGGPLAVCVDGKATLGENIADLSGLSMAIRGFLASSGDRPEIDSAGDRLADFRLLFLNWALIWRAKSRDADVVGRISATPHSPNEFRCNGPLRNIDEFYEAFDVNRGDRLYLDPGLRVRIW
ncbi:M13 family metallopeptidase [Promicromonospora sp. NFX87]|uniref:M13 family metallopeptidase n=1 Tax=Promicromonospora sp. NFX87 TaxID=3402691 RepID=UPI003AFA7335